jgi:hypothetical protein
LVVVSRNVTAYVLALVKVGVVHVFAHNFFATHDDSSPTGLVRAVKYVCIGNVLRVDAGTSLDHWQLLGIEVLIRVRSETAGASGILFTLLLVLTSRHQIGKLFLCFSKFVIIFLLIRVNSLDLIRASYLDLSAMPAHVVRMLAILRKRISKGGSHAGLRQ